jgi:hypothetical protein
MKFLDRFLTTTVRGLSPAQPTQPNQLQQPDQPHQPAPPVSAPSALALVAPALLAPVTPLLLTEFSPAIMAALAEGFALFPIDVSNRRARAATQWLPAATNNVQELHQLAGRHPGCQVGMLMAGGSRFVAVRMEGEYGASQFSCLAQRALLNDDESVWETRMLLGGNTVWAIYRSPDLERRSRRPDLGLGLRIDDWTPAPGSEFSNSAYRWVSPAARIKPAPKYLAQIVFEYPEDFQQSPKLLEFPSWVPRR